MIFLGTTFCSGRYTLHPPSAKLSSITAIQIFDGTYNQLFLSANTSSTVKNFNDEWTYDTKMNANFDSNLDAGNSGFSLRNTSHVVVKRRETGTQKWITIFVKEISATDDFNIHIKDTYAKAGTEYEYSVSSYINGIENSYVVQNVYSDFEGFYITDKDCLYGTIYDIDGCDTSKNTVTQTLNLLNSKYMTVVSNANLNCDSGSISGTFMQLNDNYRHNDKSGLQYRIDFKNRLANKKPLVLKIDDGRIWMIRVIGNPSDSSEGYRNIRQISFEWVEIGDIEDMKALYDSGLSDVDSRWW